VLFILAEFILLALIGASQCYGQSGQMLKGTTQAGTPHAARETVTASSHRQFEVVSIRPSQPGSGQRIVTAITPDGYRTRGQSLWDTLMIAYYPQPFQYWRNKLLGAPSWMSQQYDIEAKVAVEDLPEWKNQSPDHPIFKEMLRTALIDRCKLAIHTTTLNSPAYALVLSRRNVHLTHTPDGEVFPKNSVRFAPADGFMVPSGGPIQFFAATMDALAEFLTESSGRPVLNQTGLSEKYDFMLPRNSAQDSAPADPAPASPFDTEAIGLKLKPVKYPAVTLVIDHIERPSPN
jgi:uncharacterized protein (TIGR03435 family)